MPVFITVGILEINEFFAAVSPEKDADAAFFYLLLIGDRPIDLWYAIALAKTLFFVWCKCRRDTWPSGESLGLVFFGVAE